MEKGKHNGYVFLTNGIPQKKTLLLQNLSQTAQQQFQSAACSIEKKRFVIMLAGDMSYLILESVSISMAVYYALCMVPTLSSRSICTLIILFRCDLSVRAVKFQKQRRSKHV